MRYESDLQKIAFRVDNISIVNVSRDKNYKHSYRNGRTKHGFIYTVRGSIRNVFFGCETEVVESIAGDLLFVPKGTSYISTYLEDGTELKIVHFDLFSGELPEYLSKPIRIELPDAKEIIDSFFVPIKNPSANNPLYYLSRLYDLFWQLEKKHAKIPTKYKKLKPALYDISEHYAKNRPISDYAELCDMSEVNFRRLFREYTGMSPIEYRNDLRLNNAKNKLQSGEYNVTEAAEESGFSNLSFFIRLYKKKYGHTPKNE